LIIRDGSRRGNSVLRFPHTRKADTNLLIFRQTLLHPDHRRRPDTLRTAIATALFCPTIPTSFLPTIVVRPALTGEANTFCSAFETDRHAE
jgi:hypothetical protein